jgi:hypothetical protein
MTLPLNVFDRAAALRFRLHRHGNEPAVGGQARVSTKRTGQSTQPEHRPVTTNAVLVP